MAQTIEGFVGTALDDARMSPNPLARLRTDRRGILLLSPTTSFWALQGAQRRGNPGPVSSRNI